MGVMICPGQGDLLSLSVSSSTCFYNFTCDNFLIFYSGKRDYEFTVKEMVHIKFKKPSINRQLFTQDSSFVLSIF